MLRLQYEQVFPSEQRGLHQLCRHSWHRECVLYVKSMMWRSTMLPRALSEQKATHHILIPTYVNWPDQIESWTLLRHSSEELNFDRWRDLERASSNQEVCTSPRPEWERKILQVVWLILHAVAADDNEYVRSISNVRDTKIKAACSPSPWVSSLARRTEEKSERFRTDGEDLMSPSVELMSS